MVSSKAGCDFKKNETAGLRFKETIELGIEMDLKNRIYISYSEPEIGEMTLQEEIRIDLRKAGTTKELCEVYTPVIVSAIQKEIDEYKKLIGEEK